MDTDHCTTVMLRFFSILLCLVMWIGLAKVAFGQPFECVVVRGVDGDTIKILCPARDLNVETVRLIGVDTPEKGEGKYRQASSELVELAGNYVTIERFGKDRYGRTLGLVESQKGCLNVEMRKRYPSTRYDRLLTKKQRLALKGKGWK